VQKVQDQGHGMAASHFGPRLVLWPA